VANKKRRKGRKDRFEGDPDYLGSELSEQDDLAGLIEDNYRKMKKKFAPSSARGKKKRGISEPNRPNIFTGNRKQYVGPDELSKH
jgi:hypothetical protein